MQGQATRIVSQAQKSLDFAGRGYGNQYYGLFSRHRR